MAPIGFSDSSIGEQTSACNLYIVLGKRKYIDFLGKILCRRREKNLR
jgi:hypothetical protein